MDTQNKTILTVETIVNTPLAKVWELWNKAEHITKWAFASDDWHAPRAENDLRAGGKFSSRMEAKDGSMGFDFGGTYDEVRDNEFIAYTLGDGRKVDITFSAQGNETRIVENFEAESENTLELQQGGWQAIMNNFRKYAESAN
jgi:uncharacterized protein YndB with AHSA1/START domain